MSGRAEPLPPPRPDDNSYYGRPILKPPAWDWRIPAYLFAGGASAGSTLLSDEWVWTLASESAAA